MENASKALLIAGSILIVILLIAMGMRVFNSTSGTADNAETTMNATEIATFNTKFTAYFGTNKSRAQVMSLLNTVMASNSTNTLHKVTINSGDASSKMNNLGSGPFTVKAETTDYSNGYIKNIRITYKVSGVDTSI